MENILKIVAQAWNWLFCLKEHEKPGRIDQIVNTLAHAESCRRSNHPSCLSRSLNNQPDSIVVMTLSVHYIEMVIA
jgi:hypothetical protein